MNQSDSLAWMNLYSCYKEVGRMEDAQEAFRKYESLMSEGSQTDSQTNIPGGVSQTGQLASGENMDTASPGMEELKS
jgi:hypothetical protein